MVLANFGLLPFIKITTLATPNIQHLPRILRTILAAFAMLPARLPIRLFRRHRRRKDGSRRLAAVEVAGVQGGMGEASDEDGFDPVVEVFEADDGGVLALADTYIWTGVVYRE